MTTRTPIHGPFRAGAGIVLTSALAPGETSDFGTLVAPQTLAVHHQHFLSVRLDMAVDGLCNTVYEVDTEAITPGPGNPLGNAFRPVKRPLRRESEAQRVIDPLPGRYWLVANPGNRTEMGDEPAYKLIPGSNVLPFSHPAAPVTQRAAFATKHLWVTPFQPDERFPSGDYPNQHTGGAGLPAWTKADRPIENTDVVLWYTLGSHHITGPEDWPVMPADLPRLDPRICALIPSAAPTLPLTQMQAITNVSFDERWRQDGGGAMGGEGPADLTGPGRPREEETDEALRALAEPRRRAILQLVAHSELSAGEIAGCFDVTRTAVSQHLTVLKNAGLLTERRLATRRLYRARPEGLAGLREFLDQMWASSLEVARDLVEADRGAAGGGQSSAAG